MRVGFLGPPFQTSLRLLLFQAGCHLGPFRFSFPFLFSLFRLPSPCLSVHCIKCAVIPGVRHWPAYFSLVHGCGLPRQAASSRSICLSFPRAAVVALAWLLTTTTIFFPSFLSSLSGHLRPPPSLLSIFDHHLVHLIPSIPSPSPPFFARHLFSVFSSLLHPPPSAHRRLVSRFLPAALETNFDPLFPIAEI